MAERSRLAAIAAMLALAAACGSSTAGVEGTVVPDGFERTAAVLSSDVAAGAGPVELDVWYAGSPEQWQRGLTAVTDLDGADGMVFAFDGPAEYQFYMWRTPMPLDIYFFDEHGRLVGSAAMAPCLDRSASACERYSPDAPFLTALEVPSGTLDEHALDESWTISLRPPDPA